MSPPPAEDNPMTVVPPMDDQSEVSTTDTVTEGIHAHTTSRAERKFKEHKQNDSNQSIHR